MIDLYPNETLFIMWPLFLLMLAILNKFLFQPTLELIEERSRNTDQLKGDTQGLIEQTNQLMTQYEQGMASARKLAAQARDEILQGARDEERQVIEASRWENEQALQIIIQDITQQRKEVAMELRQYAQELAKLIVRKVTEREAA